jgi:hypothetical protein
LGVILYTGDNDTVWDGDTRNAGGTAPVLALTNNALSGSTGAKDRKLLNTIDVSAALKIGKATYRLGYLYVPDYDLSIASFNTDAEKKSLYFKGTLAF